MTPKWLCRPCDMLCIDRQHYDRHQSGDHSRTTDEEWERYRRPWLGYVEVDLCGHLGHDPYTDEPNRCGRCDEIITGV